MRYVCFLLVLVVGAARGQVNLNPDYSAPASRTQAAPASGAVSPARDSARSARIEADPSQGSRSPRERHVLLGTASEPTRERWYIVLEGTIRDNTGTLTNSLDQLLSTRGTTKFGGGVVTGVVLGERWSVEAGYLYQPLHNTLLLATNGRPPLILRFATNGNSFMLRGKWRLGQTGKQSNGSGLWLSGGAGLVPNKGKPLNSVAFRGTVGRGPSTADSLRLLVETYQNARWSGLAEGAVEYLFRLGATTEISVAIRRYQALGYAIRTDVTYTLNQASPATASLRTGGNGWGFGLGWRFNYSLKR